MHAVFGKRSGHRRGDSRSRSRDEDVSVQRLKRVGAFINRSDGSLQQRALRSGVWVGISSVAIVVISFARGVVLARLLTPEIFGLMTLSLSAVRLIEIFTETGFGAALIHRQERFEEARDTAYAMAVMRGIGLALVSLGMAPLLASFYGEPVLKSVVALIGFSFVLNGSRNINTVALQKQLDFKRITFLELGSTVFSFVVTVALAYYWRSVWALVWGQLAAAAANTALSFLLIPSGIRLRFDWKIAKELYRYGRFITGLAVVVFITREIDNVIVGKLLTVRALGFYTAAYTLCNIPADYLSQVVTKVMFPVFSALQRDAAKLQHEYARGVRLITAVAVPASIGIAILAPEIVQGLYGTAWSEAAVPLRILSIFGCCRALWMLNGYLYNAIGKPYVDFYANSARLLLMLVLLVPLTVRFGTTGTSWAVSLPMLLQFLVGVQMSRKFIGASAWVILKPLGIGLAQGAVMATVLLSVKSVAVGDPRLVLFALCALGGLVSLALNLRDLKTFIAAARSI